MDNLFVLKKLVSVFIVPPLLPIGLIVLGLIFIKIRPRLAYGMAWLGAIVTLLLSTPATVALIAGPLQTYHIAKESDVEKTQAIVILAGGQRFAPEFGGAAPNRISLERIHYGSRLAKRSGLPILVTGGAPTGDVPEAELIADMLKQDFGIEAKWVESHSLDTHDNARYSAAILQKAGIRKITLVTHAVHMRRAVNEFVAQGMDVEPAPMAFVSRAQNEGFFKNLPSITSAYAGWFALHEWYGLAAQAIRIRFSSV